MRLQESHGSPTPQNPWPSPKELEEAVKECISDNCRKVREIIRMATYMGPLMKIMGGFVVNTLRNYGFSTSKIERIAIIDGRRLKRLMRLGDVFEFRLVSDFKPRSLFDAYWMYTSLATLKLPFVVKSRFDPINGNICDTFGDKKLCHMYIAGYLIAEAPKSIPYRFRYMGTTHPAGVVTLLGIHLAMKMITKVYINGQKDVRFIFALPKDFKRLIEDIWRDPAILVKLTDEEFLAFLAGLLAGDGSIILSNIAEVVFTGNLRKERTLYMKIQDELRRRFGVEAFLYKWKNSNTIVLRTKNYDAVVKLLRLLPPLIEPLKELKKQVLLRKDRLGTYLAGELFNLLGDGGRNGETGIRKLQSHQAVRFFMVLLRLGLIKLKPEEGHHILEPPQTHAGGKESTKVGSVSRLLGDAMY